MVPRSAVLLVAITGGVARAEIDLSELTDIEALSLEDLLERPTITASRYALRPAESPMLVSSVDATQIDALGYRSVGEALRGMRGVYLSNDRNYSYLGSRGFAVPGDYNTRFALSIDGHRVNDIVYGQASPGLELGLPMIAVERIEMLRGGAWSVYGQNALLGAISIVTATGASRPGLEVRSTASVMAEDPTDPSGRAPIAPRAQEVSASYGTVTDRGVDVFVAANYLVDPGLAAIAMPELADADACVDGLGRPRECDGIVVGGDKEEVGGAYLAIRSKGFRFHSLAASRRKLDPTGAYGTVVGKPIETVDSRIYGDAQFSSSAPHGDVDARFALDHYDYHGDYPFASADPAASSTQFNGYNNHDIGRATWLTGELRGRYKWKRIGDYLRNVEIAGGTEGQLQHGEQRNVDQHFHRDVVYYERTDDRRTVAFSAHVLGRAFERVVGFGAVRAEYHPDAFGLAINPQLGLVLDIEEHGRVRASQVYGTRAPNVYEQTYVGLRIASFDTALEPERSQTRELSYERYLGENTRLLLVGYMQEFNGLIEFQTLDNGESRFVNAGSSRGFGGEAELDARWDAVQLRASVAYQDTHDAEDNHRVNSPELLANATVMVPMGRAMLAAETSYVGSRLAIDRTEIAPALLTTVGLTVRDLAKDLDLSIGVRNVFDVAMVDPAGEEHPATRIPGEPRTFWLRLVARLGGNR